MYGVGYTFSVPRVVDMGNARSPGSPVPLTGCSLKVSVREAN